MQEELKDVNATNSVNIHKTNLPALISMLKEGRIKGREYDIKSGNLTDRQRKICSARSTAASKYIESGLSDKIDNVRIELFNDRIKSALGIKQRPIAEYPQFADLRKEQLTNKVKKMIGRDIPDIEEANLYLKKVYKTGPNTDVLKSIIKKYCIKNHYPLRALDLLTNYYKAKDIGSYYAVNRERKERLVVDKDKGIPLDPRFMRITLIEPGKKSGKSLSKYSLENFKSKEEYYQKNKEAYEALVNSNEELVMRGRAFSQILTILKNNMAEAQK